MLCFLNRSSIPQLYESETKMLQLLFRLMDLCILLVEKINMNLSLTNLSYPINAKIKIVICLYYSNERENSCSVNILIFLLSQS